MRERLSWLGSCANAWTPHARQFYLAVVAYAVASVLVGLGLDRFDGPGRVAFALVPVLPAGWAMWALYRYMREVDELERRKYVEALTFGFAVTFLCASTAAQFELVVDAALEMHSLLTVMMLSWAVGYALASWRYR